MKETETHEAMMEVFLVRQEGGVPFGQAIKHDRHCVEYGKSENNERQYRA